MMMTHVFCFTNETRTTAATHWLNLNNSHTDTQTHTRRHTREHTNRSTRHLLHLHCLRTKPSRSKSKL